MKIFNLILYFCVLFLAKTTFGQQKISPENVQKDLVFLKNKLETFHPNLYYYSSKERFNQVYDSVFHSINQTLNYREAFVKLQTVMAAVKDGHTHINFEFPKEIKVVEPNYFPLYGRYTKEGYIVVFNGGEDSTIKRGAKLLMLDGKSIEQIAEKTNEIISSDNGEPAWKRNTTAGTVNYIFSSNDSVLVKYQNYDASETISKYVKLVPIQKFLETIDMRYPEPPLPQNFEAKMIDSVSKTTLLTIKGWNQVEVPQKNFKKHFRKVFEEIREKKAENLIIDLRNNPGGNAEITQELLSYLTNSASYVFDSQAVRKNAIKKLDFPQRWQVFFKYKKIAGTDFKTNSQNSNFLIKPKDENIVFRGKIYVLINGGSYSATCVFAAVLKNQKNAIFINSATGGARWGGFAINFYQGFLPNTKLKYKIPLMQFWNQKPLKNDNNFLIEPGFPIEVSQQEIFDGTYRKKVINFTLKMINENS